MLVKGIHWVGVCATDWDAAVAFYRDVLGLTLRGEGVQSAPEDVGARFAELRAANGDFVEVFGDGLAARELFTSPMAGFLVDDVAAARAEMESKGAVFIGPIGRGGRFEWTYFRSPTGHVHQLLAEVRPGSGPQ